MSILMAIIIANQQNSDCIMKQDQSETNATFGSGIQIIKIKANLGEIIVESSKLILILKMLKNIMKKVKHIMKLNT